jgi:hypothetical protein
MAKCPKCRDGELLLFIDRVKKAIRDPNATEEYEVVYVCSKCLMEFRREDLPLK